MGVDGLLTLWRRAGSVCALVVINAALLPAQNCRITPLLPLTLPPKVDVEPITASRTVNLSQPIPAPDGTIYFTDSYSRLRRLDRNGNLTTVLPVGTLAVKFDSNGILHVALNGRLFQMRDRELIPIAGSGRLGFNGESGPALEVNLGGIRDFAFDRTGTLLILDDFGRIRRLEPNGHLRAIAGSSRRTPNPANGGIPATEAGLSAALSIWPAPDGSIILPRVGVIDAEGTFRIPNPIPSPEFRMPDGRLLVATRFFGAKSEEFLSPIEEPTRDKAIFHNYPGNAAGITPAGELLVYETTPTDLRLSRFKDGTSNLIVSIPKTSGFLAVEPQLLWDSATRSVYYSGTNGITKFTADGASSLIAADRDSPIALGPEGSVFAVRDNRIIRIRTDGSTSTVNGRNGPLFFWDRTGSTLRRPTLAWSSEGFLYWHSGRDSIFVWRASSQSSVSITAQGTEFLVNLPDGTAATWIGAFESNGPKFLRRLVSASIGLELNVLPRAILSTASIGKEEILAIANGSKLLRVRPSGYDLLTLKELELPYPATIQAVAAIPGGAVIAFRSGSQDGLVRIEDIDNCDRLPVPVISRNGIVNAANYLYSDAIAYNSLLAIFGTHLATASSQSGIHDQNGNLTSASPDVPDFSLPVLHATPNQLLVQWLTLAEPEGAIYDRPHSLSWLWQGIRWYDANELAHRLATPALFTASSTGFGQAAALNQDGTVNSESNPALPGTVIQLFGTGFGAITEPVGNGQALPTDALSPLRNPASIRIGGQSAGLLYAGGAPGQLSGVFQVNAIIPLSAASGSLPVELTVAGEVAIAPGPVTVKVR